MKDWVHPAIRPGTIWFRFQAIGLGGLAAGLVLIAILDRTTEKLIYAAVAVAVVVLVGYPARRAIRQLRYEYRYEADADSSAEQP